METNNMIGKVVGITVALVCVAVILMPVLSDATTTEKTFTNEGLYYMTDLGAEDSIVYTFDGTTWTVDGETANFGTSEATTIVALEGTVVRANGQIRGNTIITPASITEMTVTATGLSITYLNSSNVSASTTVTADVYYCAVIDESDATLSAYNSTNYVNSDSEITGCGMITLATGTVAVANITGTIDDGFTVTINNSDTTVDDVTCNYEAVDGYEDLYEVTSITFTTTYNDSERSQTFTSYVVPVEVTAELSHHLSNGEIAIVNAIPVMIIVAIVLMSVGIIVSRRD